LGCQGIFQVGIAGFIDFIHHLVFEWNMLFWKLCSFLLSYDENRQEPSVWNARQCLEVHNKCNIRALESFRVHVLSYVFVVSFVVSNICFSSSNFQAAYPYTNWSHGVCLIVFISCNYLIKQIYQSSYFSWN